VTGTGSETTFGAIIKDPVKEIKFLVADLRILPKVAFLDPLLVKDLPAAITAATSMDVLTHVS